jgi:hypothetical protein
VNPYQFTLRNLFQTGLPMEPFDDNKEKTNKDAPLKASIKRRLMDCLSQVDCARSFATFAIYPRAANPGITIAGIGKVGLPLSERDAQAIIKISHRAPFGKGSHTIVDTTVRKTWELNVGQFKLENPSWQRTLQEIVGDVKTKLGVRSEIEALPYKMLLYEEGAMFKPHKEYATRLGLPTDFANKYW